MSSKRIVRRLLSALLIYCAVTSPTSVHSQSLSWDLLIDDSPMLDTKPIASAIDGSGAAVVVSQTFNGTHFAILVKKISSSGATVWSTAFDATTSGDDFASAVTLDSSGNVYVCGKSDSPGTGFDVLVFKLNASNGSLLWHYTEDGNGGLDDEGLDIITDTNGGVTIVGYSGNGYYLSRRSAQLGTLIWDDISFSSSTWHTKFLKVNLTNNGQIKILASYGNVGGNLNFTQVHTFGLSAGNSFGFSYWSMSNLGLGFGPDYPVDFVVNPSNGDAYVIGYNDAHCFLLATGNPMGTLIGSWPRNNGSGQPTAIDRSSNGEIVVVGYEDLAPGIGVIEAAYTRFYLEQGILMWTESYPNYAESRATDVAIIGGQTTVLLTACTSDDCSVVVQRHTSNGNLAPNFPVVYESQNYSSNLLNEYSLSIHLNNLNSFHIFGGVESNSDSGEENTILAKYCTYSGSVAITGPPTICQGSSAVFNASGGVGYSWSLNNNWLSGSSGGSTTVSVPISAQTGQYQLSVTGTDTQGCSQSTSIPFTVLNTPAAPTIQADGATSFCAGGSVVLMSSFNGTNLWTGNQETPNGSFTVSTQGNYTATAVNANGCSSPLSNSITVNVNAAPVVQFPQTTITSCGNFNLEANVSGGTPPYIYQWSNGASTSNVTIDSTTSISLQVEDQNGCFSGLEQAQITIVEVPDPPIIEATTALDVCAPETVQFISIPNQNVNWHLDNEFVSSSSTLTLNTGSGVVSATLTINGCDSDHSNQVAIAIHPETILNITPENPVLCSDSELTLTVASSIEISNYNWLDGLSDTNTLVVSESGTVTVETIDINGCSSTIEVVVLAADIPDAPTIEISQNGEFILSDVTSEHNWYFNGALIDGETGFVIYPELGGIYWATITVDGCESEQSNSIQWSTPINIDEVQHLSEMHIVRLTSEELSLEMPNSGFWIIELYDALGHLLLRESITGNTHTLVLNQFSRGCLFVVAYDATKDDLHRLKFLKLH